MSLFSIFKSGKSKEAKNKFVGRHQQACLVYKFLGKDIPELEFKIASNKDNDERNEIIKKLTKIEEYINSDLFTNHLSVQSINKEIQELVYEGYKTCVLNNDINLQNRCTKIYNKTVQYMKTNAGKWKLLPEEMTNLLEPVMNDITTKGFLDFVMLGGLFPSDASQEQKAWIIMSSLWYSNKLVKIAVTLLPPDLSQKQAKKIRHFADELFREKRISKNDLQKIEKEILEGLPLSQEYWKSTIENHEKIRIKEKLYAEKWKSWEDLLK